jgi:cytochrome c
MAHSSISPCRAVEPCAALETADKNYKTLCADCHGTDGRGKEYRESGISIPDFTSKTWFQNKTTSQLKLAILLGKGEEMPPFEDELTAEAANQLAVYVRTFAGLKASDEPQRSSASRNVLQKELEQFQQEWSQLADRWEEEFNLLRRLAGKRPQSQLVR